MVASTTGGHGVRAAVTYLIHDKATDEDPRPKTSNRVAWTHTVNLPTDDVELAARIIQGQRYDAPFLKAAAGVGPGGRPLKQNIQLTTFSWHPSEKPTKEEMISAAMEGMAVLGLEKLPVILVAHCDRHHRHVHAIGSRIDPETGRAKNIHQPKLKLSRWATEYEQRRGRIFVPRRLERQAARARYNPSAPIPLPPMQPRHRPGGRTAHTEAENKEWRTLYDAQGRDPSPDLAQLEAVRVGLARMQDRRRRVNARLADVRAAIGAGVRTGANVITSRVGAGVATTATTMSHAVGVARRAGRAVGITSARHLGTGAELLTDGAIATVRATGKGIVGAVAGIARLPSRAVDVAMALIPGDGGAEAERFDRAVRSVERDRRRGGLDLRAPRPATTPTPSEPPRAKKKKTRSWTSWRKPAAALPRPPQRSGTMPSPKPAPPLAGSGGPDHTGQGPRR